MEIEKKLIKLMKNGTIIESELSLHEEAPDDIEKVLLEITMDGEIISCVCEDFFHALTNLRKELEEKHIQIMCNGAAKIVYPSPMQLSMGTGRAAYKQFIGQQATMSDVVDIFECDESLCFVGINEQSEYHQKWLQSITG